MISPSTVAAAAGIAAGAAPSMRTLAVPLSSFVPASLATPVYPPTAVHRATGRRLASAVAADQGEPAAGSGVNRNRVHR